MPPIGDTLREARMRQKLDIADVEERTKIRAKYLRALENEEFGLLPGSTFVKTFLRTYAEVLGLDPHRLVEEYRTGYEEEDELEAQPLGGPPAAGPPHRGRGLRTPGPPGRGATLIGVVVAILAFLLILGLVSGEEEGEQGNEQAGPTTREQTEPRPRPRPRRRPRPVASSVTLQVTPAVPTYVCLDQGVGTPVLFEGVLQQARTFKGRRLRVNLGKTSVQLQANGRAVPIPESPNPVGFEFTPRETRPIPLGRRPCVGGL
jgi:cytoskeleton protein RodZ